MISRKNPLAFEYIGYKMTPTVNICTGNTFSLWKCYRTYVNRPWPMTYVMSVLH